MVGVVGCRKFERRAHVLAASGAANLALAAVCERVFVAGTDEGVLAGAIAGGRRFFLRLPIGKVVWKCAGREVVDSW